MLLDNGKAVGGGGGGVGIGIGRIRRKGRIGPIFSDRGLEFVRGKLSVEPGGEVCYAGLVFHELTEGDFEAEVFFEGIGS